MNPGKLTSLKIIGVLVMVLFTGVQRTLPARSQSTVQESRDILESVEQAVSDEKIPASLESWTRGRVAAILAKNGQIESSLRTVREASDPGIRTRLMRRVVTNVLREENPPLTELLHLLREDETRILADLLIPPVVRTDQRSLARRWAVQHSRRGRCLHDTLAEAYIRRGLVEDLTGFLPGLKPPSCRGRARAILAREYARQEQHDRAERQFALAREELSNRPEGLAVLAYRQSQAGYRARARTTFHDAYRRAKEVLHDSGPVQADRAFAVIVDYQLRADLPETTWSSIWMRGADTEAVRRTHLNLARYWAREGRLEQALSVADSLDFIGETQTALLIVARELITRGDTETAHRLGQRLTNPQLSRKLSFYFLKHRACSGDRNAAKTNLSTLPRSSELYYRGWFWLGHCQTPNQKSDPGETHSGPSAPADWFYRLGVLSSARESPVPQGGS